MDPPVHSSGSSYSSDAIAIGIAVVILLSAALWLLAIVNVEAVNFLVDSMSRFGPSGLHALGG